MAPHVSAGPQPEQTDSHESAPRSNVSDALNTADPLTSTSNTNNLTYPNLDLGFSLTKNGSQNLGGGNEMSAIMDHFPTCQKVSVSSPFITIVCRELPLKPWPVTVADLPAYFTPSEREVPIGHGFFESPTPLRLGLTTVNNRINIDPTLKTWETPSSDAIKAIFEHLDSFDLGFRRLQWTGCWFRAVSATRAPSGWQRRLPTTFNRVLISYLFEEPGPDEQTLRERIWNIDGPSQNASADRRACVDPAKVFTGLQDVCVHQRVTMQTASNNRFDGALVGIEWVRLPRCSDGLFYRVFGIAYFGNDEEKSHDDCHGALLLDESHDILGRFCYTVKDHAQLLFFSLDGGLDSMTFMLSRL